MEGDTPSENDVSTSRSVLANGLHVSPPSYAFTAVRTRAFAVLDDVARWKVTAVTAPPGYGKTVLLAEAYRHVAASGRNTFWIGIDAHDRGQISLIDALEQSFGAGRDAIPKALDYRRPPSVRDRVNGIIQKIATVEDPFFLFIDNADLAQEGESRLLLDALIFETDETCRLIVSSSTDQPFDTTRAFMEMRVKVIGPAELGFGLDQVKSLFQEAGLSNLSAETANRILQQSEGWPAAVRLMQVLASTRPGPGTDDHNFAWDGERLADSLFEKLLQRLSSDLQTFLSEVAIFTSFSSELVSWATESAKAREFLRYLVEHKVLIVSLDDSGSWYRFHALFRRYLVRRAADAIGEDRVRDVTVRGAQWLERHGLIEASLDLALQAHDRPLSVRLLEKLSWSLVRGQGHLPTFIAWADKVQRIGGVLGDEAGFWLVWALIFERRYDEASAAIVHLIEQIETRSLSPKRKRLSMAKAGLAEIVLKLHMDDLRSIQMLAPAWLEEYFGVEPFEHGAAAGALALSLLADHDFSSATSAARTSLAAVGPTSSLYGRAWASNISTAIAVGSGSLDRIEDSLLDLERQIRSEIDDDSLIASVTLSVRARTLYERGSVGEATTLALRALPVVRNCGMLDFIWLAFEVIVPLAMEDESRIGLGTLRQIAAEYPKRLSTLLDLTLIRLFCNSGRVALAQELGEHIGIWTPSGQFRLPTDFLLKGERAAAHLAAIALMTAAGDLRGAEELLGAEMIAARDIGRRGAIVDLYLAQAAIHIKSGEQRNATRAFSRAINLASQCGSIRPFYEQRALVARLIISAPAKELALTTDAARKTLECIADLIGAQPSGETYDALATISEPLTKRELELLRMLDAGMDNAQISGASDISVRTVKWHLRNLYSKLDVKNRTSAIARARQMQLL